MNGFSPINPSHAVAEFVAMIEFQGLSDSTFAVIRTNSQSKAIRDFLPNVEEVQGLNIDIHNAQVPVRTLLRAVEYKRFRSEGLEWLMRVFPESISIHCLFYSRWAEILPTIEMLFEGVLNNQNFASLPISQIGLRYIDRFIYTGDVAQYSADKLFRRDSTYLSPNVFSARQRWHCHTGWFEDPSWDDTRTRGNLEVLHQVNVDTAVVRFVGGQGVGHTVNHAALVRQLRAGAFGDYIPRTDGDASAYAQMMTALHHRNKEILAEIITEEMAARIDLGG